MGGVRRTAYADTRDWVGVMHPHTRTYSFSKRVGRKRDTLPLVKSPFGPNLPTAVLGFGAAEHFVLSSRLGSLRSPSI